LGHLVSAVVAILDFLLERNKIVHDHQMNIPTTIGFSRPSDFGEEYLNVKV
jgi:hypothetical protein